MQRLALVAVGNLAFCLENRRVLVTSESLRELLLRMAVATEPRVYKAAARALAILGLPLEITLAVFSAVLFCLLNLIHSCTCCRRE